MRGIAPLIAACACVVGAQQAHASERAGASYGYGAEALAIADLPPPGLYALNYSTYYNADRLNDRDGDSAVPDFSIDAAASIFRLVYVTKMKVLGASYAVQVVMPVVDLTVHSDGRRGHKSGIGDMIVTPVMLGWRSGRWHVVSGVDVVIPVGGYKPEKLVNLSRNYWTFEPVIAISNIGQGRGPDLSLKLMYDINTRNNKTRYRSGNEFHADFAIGYNFQPLSIGINGYYVKQVEDDKENGLRVGSDGYRGEVFALGPTVKYQLGGVPISLQWQHELHTENRPQGDKFWIKTAFRF